MNSLYLKACTSEGEDVSVLGVWSALQNRQQDLSARLVEQTPGRKRLRRTFQTFRGRPAYGSEESRASRFEREHIFHNNAISEI
jgi:hypothetical protein